MSRNVRLTLRCRRDELDYVKHAARLRGQPMAEYVKRAINAALRKQGVDALLFAESKIAPTWTK